MTHSHFNLNTELANIDRNADMFISRMMLSAKQDLLRSREPEFDTDAICEYLIASMIASHDLALETISLRRQAKNVGVVQLSDRDIVKVLKAATKPEKDSLRKLYGSIARSVTNQAMSKVRSDLVNSAISEMQDKNRQADKGLKSALGATKPNKKSSPTLRTIFRTQTSIAYNAAAWEENQDDGDVWGYEYTTAGDERVRDSHAVLDNVRYNKRDPFWLKYAPPNGWNCRCSLVPIYRGEAKARKRPARSTPDVDTAFRVNFGKIFSVAI